MFPTYLKRIKKEIFTQFFMKKVNLYIAFTNKMIKLNEKNIFYAKNNFFSKNNSSIWN